MAIRADRQGGEMRRGTPVIIAGAVLVLVAALTLAWPVGPARLTAEPPDGAQGLAAVTAGHRQDATVTPRGQSPMPAGAVDPSPTTPKPVRAEPADANECVEGAYRAIGEPLNPDQAGLPEQEPAALGEALDADDPAARPPGEHDGDPVRLGDPLDADAPMDEAGDFPAEANHIGEPLDADLPE